MDDLLVGDPRLGGDGPALQLEPVTQSSFVLDSNIEAVLAPQEALGRSTLEILSEIQSLLELQSHPKTTSAAVKAQISRLKQLAKDKKINIMPLLARIQLRVEGCHTLAAYDVSDLAKTSVLILNLLVKINQYARVHSLPPSDS